MLPSIFKNATTAQGGAQILDSIGVDKDFIDKKFDEYSSHLSKIPGMNSMIAKPLLGMIKGAMKGKSSGRKQEQNRKPKTSFDKSKYPKV